MVTLEIISRIVILQRILVKKPGHGRIWPNKITSEKSWSYFLPKMELPFPNYWSLLTLQTFLLIDTDLDYYTDWQFQLLKP